jgi:hypothetical protein
LIARSITEAIVDSDNHSASVLNRFPAFFWLYWMQFECVQADLFKTLRKGVWQLKEQDYIGSFGGHGEGDRPKLQAMGMQNWLI